MMKLKPELSVAALSITSALAATLLISPLIFDNPALALDPKPAPAADAERHHHRLPSETVEARLAYAKTLLKITDAQTQQWNAVADVIRKQAKDRDAAFQNWHRDQGTEHTIIDRLERRQKMMTKAATDTSTLLEAARPLYAVLSTDQKKTADELIGHRFGGGHMGHHFGPHGFMPPQPDAPQSEQH